MKGLRLSAVVLSCLALTASCGPLRGTIFDPKNNDLIDPQLGLDRDDFKRLTDSASYAKDNAGNIKMAAPGEPPVPEFAEILATPKPPKLGETQLVSVAVTDDVPLKDVLIELARLADVDIEVDAGIAGGVSFRAKDRPFNEVIERLADLAGLRYSMKNGVLRVERDTPFVQIYSLDFLNLDRSSTSSVNVSTNVLSSGGSEGGGGGGSSGGSGGSSGGSGGGSSSGGGGGGGSSGLQNGSSSTITAKADSDFWKQFEEGVKQILAYKPPKRVSDISIAEQPAARTQTAAATAPAAGGAVPAAAAPVAATSSSSGTGATGSTTSNKTEEESFYIINRQAATLTISATEKQQELMREFIRRIQINSSAQVLIEAKIVEVSLNNQFQSGIDWTKLGTDKISFASTFGDVADAKNVAKFSLGKPTEIALTKNIDLAAAVSLAEIFGTTRTLSSPRLHAINNQEAVLTFAENQIYFSLNVTQSQSAAPAGGASGINTLTVTSTPHTVPIGIILAMQPSINPETSEVTLNIRPTLSRVTGTVTDPAIAFTLAQAKLANPGIDLTGISSSIPIIEVRELDSILKLKSGQVMVIGGLMQDKSINTDKGLPGVSGIPWVGNLFKGVDKQSDLSELVIFIRATIVDSAGSADQADKNVYEKFTKDPRPLNF